MSGRQYRFASATVLTAAAVAFFIMPAVFDFDAFIPFLLTLVCLFSALAMFFTGGADG